MPVTVRPRLAAAVVAGGALLLAAAPAAAHVSPDRTEVAAGSYTEVQLLVPHGCGDLPTEVVTVQIPPQLSAAAPEIFPGWDITVEPETLAEPLDDGHGGEITERVATITWTAQEGEALPSEFRARFGIGFQAPEDAEGEYLFFKTIQSCPGGEESWIEEYTGEGEGEEPDRPAPAVLVTAATGDGHGDDEHGDETESDETGDGATDEVAGTPVAATSTPGGDDGAPVGLTVAAMVAAVGALGLGGLALARTRRPA